MGLIVELILWIIIEIIFWGIMFWSGYVIVLIVTFGHYSPKQSGKSKAEVKGNRKKPEFLITAVIGTLFWIGVGIALTFLIKNI